MSPELCEVILGLQMVLFDVDGVLTDGRILLGGAEEEAKAFHVHDGVGIRLLQREGIEVGLLTGRRSAAVRRRAEELGIELVMEGCEDKRRSLDELLDARGIRPSAVAYMGDDLPDLPVFARVGFSAAPHGARPEVCMRAHLVTCAAGGAGAVREFAEHVVALRSRDGARRRAEGPHRTPEAFMRSLRMIHGTLAAFIHAGAEANAVDAALEIMARRPRLLVAGLGKSGHVARSLAALFTAMGTPAYFLHAGEALHGDLGIAVDEPAVLLLSKSGRTREMVRLARELKRRMCACIAITCDPMSPVARLSHVVIDLGMPTELDTGGVVPTTSVTMMHAIGSALAVSLVERRGVSPDTFCSNHPGGVIGERVHARETMG